ncbi:hypothetical protein ACERII_03700 [Evansella sp. AB-rgal1]|uniref:hypothetical protein n=1 Tax=Evansella sp. AB-rgal1 TaxID=3242696 RepID=UPI00359CC386
MEERSKQKKIILFTSLISIILVSGIIFTVFHNNDNQTSSQNLELDPSEKYIDETATVINAGNYDYQLYHKVEELEQYSDHIVKVKVTGDRQLVTWKDEYDSTDPGVSGTQSAVEILEVYKGSLSNNEIIIVNEPAYFKDHQYYGGIITGMYQGKYDMTSTREVKPVTTLNRYKDVKDVEFFGDDNEIAHFNNLKKQVIDKFK